MCGFCRLLRAMTWFRQENEEKWKRHITKQYRFSHLLTIHSGCAGPQPGVHQCCPSQADTNCVTDHSCWIAGLVEIMILYPLSLPMSGREDYLQQHSTVSVDQPVLFTGINYTRLSHHLWLSHRWCEGSWCHVRDRAGHDLVHDINFLPFLFFSALSCAC